MRKILTLDSHQLSAYQQCPTKFMFGHLIGLETQQDKVAFQIGQALAAALAIGYRRKMRGQDPNALYLQIWRRFMRRFPEKGDIMCLLISRYWRLDLNSQWIPLAVEKGFSKVIYEDSDHLFIYEGRPDLIAKTKDYKIVVDHKSQSMTYNIYPFNNQARGYIWATDAKFFCYNYFNLVKDETKQFRTEIIPFSPEQIADWRDTAIQSYFDILRDRERRKFNQHWNCQDKYGLCPFTPLCEQPDYNVKAWIIKSQFKIRKRWRAW